LSLDLDSKRARSMLLKFLTYRSRSIKEAIDYLKSKGFTDDTSEAIIGEMINYGYLNDEKFVDNFIAYRKNQGYGILKVRHELIIKGITRDLIEEKLEASFSRDGDLVRIKALLEKRVSREQKIDVRWVKRQAAFLKRRGFQDSLILAVLNEHYSQDSILSE
jgi:regulatory protein